RRPRLSVRAPADPRRGRPEAGPYLGGSSDGRCASFSVLQWRAAQRVQPRRTGQCAEYWEIHPDGRVQHFSWITDFLLIPENVWDIMRGGRARWKIENETFNTLKNQGYHLEHNYGHGEQNLSVVLALLMMLAFLVDQVQQLCCPLFQAAWHKMKTKCHLWEELRNHFRTLLFDSMADLLTALIRGIAPQKPVFENSS